MKVKYLRPLTLSKFHSSIVTALTLLVPKFDSLPSDYDYYEGALNIKIWGNKSPYGQETVGLFEISQNKDTVYGIDSTHLSKAFNLIFFQTALFFSD